MKTIYIFTVSNDIADVQKFNSDLRLLAYLMYMDISEYEEDCPIIVRNKKILENDIVEYNANGEIMYKLKYDDTDLSNCYVNPLLIGNNSFAITVYKDSIQYNDILFILKNNIQIVNSNYTAKIIQIDYKSISVLDESNRIKAIDSKIERCKKKRKINSLISSIWR